MHSLMPGYRRGGTFAIRHGQRVPHEVYLAQIQQLARSLPEAPYLINLCEDRYLFSLSLCAALAQDIRTLLPPNRLPATVRDIAGRYPGSLVLTDGSLEDSSLPHLRVAEPDPAPSIGDLASLQPPRLPDRSDAILVFTSGSTGVPQPHAKRWADQMICSDCAAHRFQIAPETGIVATVPPQHMYGLELSVLIPLATGAAVHTARPFFPEDIRAALAETPAPRVLVTTPVHLKACVQAGLDWPEIAFLISATAPLGAELAEAAERHLDTSVYEIFGCTEAGSIASRRTLDGPVWRWYDAVRARDDGGCVSVSADFLPGWIPLNDRFALEDAQHFRLLGRGSDQINVGGKRASLADLNRKLCAIPGVEDGLILDPDDPLDQHRRLAAVVVAPGLDRAALLTALRTQIDPVFLPRRIRFVERLPRNEVGKTPRQWLLSLLEGGRGDEG